MKTQYLEDNQALGATSLPERIKRIQHSICYLSRCIKGQIPHVQPLVQLKTNLAIHKQNLKELRRSPS